MNFGATVRTDEFNFVAAAMTGTLFLVEYIYFRLIAPTQR